MMKLAILARSYKNSIELAIKHNLASIAFPFISTGVYGYPKSKACNIAVYSVKTTLVDNNYKMKVVFVLFSDEDHKLFAKELLKHP